jgi:hypothetical protein
MAEVIGLINDISPSVKLGWIGVLAWAAVQFVWYRRARVLPGEAESLARSWSAGHQFPSVTRPPETDPIDEAPRSYAPEPVIAAAASFDVDIDIDVDGNTNAEIPFESDELAEFLGTEAPRRRSSRRRRTTANNSVGGGVSEFALGIQKVP